MNTPETLSIEPSRRVPNKRVWAVVLAAVLGTIFVRQIPLDLAIANIVSFALLLTGFVTLLAWFVFRSDYPVVARWLPVVCLVVGGSVYASQWELVGVNGSMIPKFARRDAERHDEALAANTNADSTISVDVLETSDMDFPCFLGPNRNSSVTGVALDPDWEKHPPELLWKNEIGAGWSGFAVVNGFAFTMEQRGPDELVTCYRVDDGELCWHHSVAAKHETIMGYRGPRSTPTVAEGRVYAMGATGVLRCLDGATGDELWIRDLFVEHGFDQASAESAVAWGRSSSPLVVGDTLYIPVGGPKDGRKIPLLAVDSATGETKWETDGEQTSYATPALLNVAGVDQIVMVNESNVVGYAIEDGTELWSHPWEGKSNMNASASQPHVVDEDFVLLSKGYGKGAELIELSVGDAGEWTVEPVWASRVLKTKFSNVAIQGGVVFGLDDGILSAVEVQSGKKFWKKGRYKYGQILLVGDHLLVMAEDGDLCLVNASGLGYEELGRITALEGQTWNTIAIYGDRVLVRNSEQAACFRLKLIDSEN